MSIISDYQIQVSPEALRKQSQNLMLSLRNFLQQKFKLHVYTKTGTFETCIIRIVLNRHK